VLETGTNDSIVLLIISDVYDFSRRKFW